MSDLSALFPGSAGSDFSAVLGAREWVIGFVAYREWTEVLLGEEAQWYALPSWLTGVLFVVLALTEWLVLRFVGQQARRWWERRKKGVC